MILCFTCNPGPYGQDFSRGCVIYKNGTKTDRGQGNVMHNGNNGLLIKKQTKAMKAIEIDTCKQIKAKGIKHVFLVNLLFFVQSLHATGSTTQIKDITN